MTNRSTSREVAGPPASGQRGAPPRLLDELGDWAGGSGPVYRRLARALAGAIDRGTLAAGARLPSERALARRLALSRGTVLAAYDRLAGDGVIERRHGSGTFVAGPVPGAVPGPFPRPALPPDREGTALVHHLADAGRAGPDAHPPAVPALIDLSLSVAHDLDHLDLPTLSAADLRAAGPANGYTPWGLPGLRAAVARHVTGWGLPSTAEQIVITTGAQQAIAAAAACWVRPGDAVVCEDPTYPGALAAFRQAGARLVGVPVDRHGVVVDALARAVATTSPALVYLQPDVHSPTGAVLPERRRRAVADLLGAARIPLVEDLALTDTAWSRPPLPIAVHAGAASVAVVGSLSKAFWGGLRVGFVRAPEPLAQRFARVKATLDLGSSVPGQVLAERLLAGDVATALHRRRSVLQGRADALSGALRSRLPSWRWSEPGGGLSLWVRLPGDAAAVARHAREHGVVVATPGPLSPADGHGDRLRLSFDAPPALLVEAVDRLARAWRP
jgi:DNA-binding transcriptional MocR family regulator